MFTNEDKITFNNILNNQNEFIDVYKVVKRKGNKVKVREIIAPKLEYKDLLKKILYWFVSNNVFQVSDVSFAWIPGKSREMCATRHINHRYLLEADISDYFGNIKLHHIEGLFVYNDKISYLLNILETDLQSLIAFLTHKRSDAEERYLAQGFPTSPILANAVRYGIDTALIEIASVNNWTYSAYGDNLYLSGERVPRETIDSINAILQSYGFSLSRHKCKIMPYYRRQTVLGIVVNKKLSVPKDYLKNVISEIIKSDNDNPSLKGKINQFRINNNSRNLKYLNTLQERVYESKN